jgi:hypothetical protein
MGLTIMYKHGKPVYRLTRRPIFIISLFLLAILAAAYFFIIRPNSGNTFNNDPNARTSSVKTTTPTDTPIDEAVFSATLPGPWKLSAQDWDARYHSYQWNSSDKKNNGRLFRVYVDTMPKDQAVNYLLPVKVQGNVMSFGTVSDNCVNFTQGAVPEDQRPVNIPLDKIALPSRWGLVDFLCDNGHVSGQVVGATSSESLNTISLSGPTKGSHKFFFMYQDNNISPDFGLFQQILASFKVK